VGPVGFEPTTKAAKNAQSSVNTKKRTLKTELSNEILTRFRIEICHVLTR